MAYRVQQANPAANTDEDLYQPSAGTEAVISTFSVCNTGTADSSFRIAIRKNGASVTTSHYIVHEEALAAGESKFFTIGAVVTEDDVVTVRAATAAIAFNAFVNETDV